MDNKTLLAVISALIDDRIKELTESITIKRGPRGLRGPMGERGESVKGEVGEKGEKGESVEVEDLLPLVRELVLANKLTFEELSETDKEFLRGEKGEPGETGLDGRDGRDGLDGQSGTDGKNFDYEEHAEKITKTLVDIFNHNVESLKLHFDDLSAEEKEFLKLKFSDLTEDEIYSLKLKFADLSEAEKESLKLNFSDLNEDEVDSLKMKFSDLNEEEKSSLRGPRGLRGQIGKSIIGPQGMPGVAFALDGRPGRDGKDGEDAPIVLSIGIDVWRDEFALVFSMSDGTTITTNYVTMPSIQKLVSSYSTIVTGGTGGGLSAITVQQNGTAVGDAKILNFTGDITVTFDPLTETATVNVNAPTPTPTCIPIFDEGVEVTPCVQSIDFVGDGVEVVVGTKIDDWAHLSDVDNMATYTPSNIGHVQVRILQQETAKRLEAERIANEAITIYRLVTAVSGTHVELAQHTVEAKARVLGIALNNAAAGEVVRILFFGNIEHSSFVFPLNVPLFLSANGTITNIPPAAPCFYTVVASSNGSGSIFMNIDEPIESY